MLRTRRRRSQEDLARALSLTRSTLSGYENGVAEPSIGVILRVADYFQLSTDLLLREDMSTYSERKWNDMERNADNLITGANLRVLATAIDRENREQIELVPEKARAGYALGYADPEFISVLPAFNLPFLSQNRKYRSFQISGDSMPPVSHGSFVIGEYIQNWNLVRDGFPYLVVTREEGVVFKVLYNLLEKNHSFRLCSTNPLYPPYEVPVSDVLEIWKFVYYMSSELPEPALGENQIAGSLRGLQQDLAEIKNEIKNRGNQTGTTAPDQK